MRLIDMEKALSELCLSHKDIIYIDKNETAERIRKIPSIDIVRCKECKYEPICTHSVQHTTRDAHSVTIGYKSVEWCSYGERGEP